MKKLYAVFMMFFCVHASTNVSALELSYTPGITLDANGYARRGQCKVLKNNCGDDKDGTVYIGNTGSCYMVDSGFWETKYCDNQVICILGYTENAGSGLGVTNGCWWSRTSISDDAMKHDDELDFAVCDGNKYQYKQGKKPVFLNDNNEILSDEKGVVAQSVVSVVAEFLHKSFLSKLWNIEPNIKCIAYVCWNGKQYSEPNDDGSCDGAGATNQNSATVTIDTANNGGGNSGSGCKHRDTVMPYLNALGTK